MHGLDPHNDHDVALISHAHPADWVNPQPASRYNLVVIGGGTAGLVSAAGAAALGAKVALIERRLLGGDCLTFGCVPSKALLRCARAVADVRSASSFGVEVPDGAHVDFPRVMERMRRLRASISPNDSAQRFRSLGVDVFIGHAHFLGPDKVEVDGQTLLFRRAILATGTRPAIPSIPGLAEVGYLTNETVFSLTELPRRLAIIGAGPIGAELAQAFARFGAQVTLIANHEQLLPREDSNAAGMVADHLRRDGVNVLVNRRVVAASRNGDDCILEVDGDGERQSIRIDAILVATGRAPVVDGLDLEAAGVEHDAAGIKVNDRLQTTSRRIFAAGDICSRFKFTHAADALARIALQNALFLRRLKASDLVIPWCTYTDPELAHVGLTAAEASLDRRVQTYELRFDGVDRAVLDGETEGLARIHARGDRIVGATIVARHAGDMIGEVALAMTGGLGLKTLAATIHPYPTQAEVLKKLGDAYNRTRLTPIVHWLFNRWLQWNR